MSSGRISPGVLQRGVITVMNILIGLTQCGLI